MCCNFVPVSLRPGFLIFVDVNVFPKHVVVNTTKIVLYAMPSTTLSRRWSGMKAQPSVSKKTSLKIPKDGVKSVRAKVVSGPKSDKVLKSGWYGSEIVDSGIGQNDAEPCSRQYILCGDLDVRSLVEAESVYADGECFVMFGDSLHARHTDFSGSIVAKVPGSVDSVVDMHEFGDGFPLDFERIHGHNAVCSSLSQPTGIFTVRDAGWVVKTHPFDFPLGFGDGQVPDLIPMGAVITLSESVQHLFRFVVPWRGRPLSEVMDNKFMIHYARQRGYFIPRNVKRRIGLDFHQGAAVIKRASRNGLEGLDHEGVPGDKIIFSERFVENHMDPCLRFPYDDLQELFDGATMIEGMLVALEHMQICFVSCTPTGLQTFHRNVISFPHHLSAFVSQHGLGRGYRVTDRVNSSRGPGQDLNRRPLKYWDPVVANMKEKLVHRADGDIIYAAEVLQVMPDGSLLLQYDIGGQGVELPSWVRPRAQMPWHPKDVPLVLHLQRNIGRGAVIEGLSVRWEYVSRLLRALCSFAPNGQVWRLGGGEYEAMHKYYDPKILDVLNVDDMRSRVESTADFGTLPVELKSIGDLAIAGFRIKVNESESVDFSKSDVWVEEKTFVRWLFDGNFMVGAVVAAWWTGLYPTDPAGQNTYFVGC